MKRRSPLQIPPQRGRTFRVIISGTLGTIAGWGLTQVWVALQTGVLDWSVKRGPIHIERASRPEMFWLFIIAFFLGFLWLLYVCCAEIVYAMLWYEP